MRLGHFQSLAQLLPEHLPGMVSASSRITFPSSPGNALGDPPPGAMKFFLTIEIEQKKADAK